MRAIPSQLPFVKRAEELASLLKGVERNVFLAIVADFLTDPRSEPSRLERMLDLLKKDSGNHLNRSGGFGEQARVVVQRLPSILKDPELSPAELRTVLGWTSRLLQVRSGKSEEGHGGSQRSPEHRRQDRPPVNQQRPTKPLRPVSRAAPPLPAPVVSSAPAPPNWEARIQGLGWGNAGPIVSTLLSELEGDTRREAAKAIIEKMGGKKALRAKKDKPWVQALLEAAGE
ncbi:MAG: hypothetical protein QOF89_1045 [Acidobacteriota bacterium]|jgi:hypothetical protein|nr:hypothetical protein [Acidobacteriota bacterium]